MPPIVLNPPEPKPEYGIVRTWGGKEVLCPVQGTVIQGRLAWCWAHEDGSMETGLEPEGRFVWWNGRNALRVQREEYDATTHGKFFRNGTLYMRCAR